MVPYAALVDERNRRKSRPTGATCTTHHVTAPAPIKVNERTKDRVRYLAALTDVTQAEIVDRAVSEYATRHADDIAKGIDRAREVLAGGGVAVAAHLLGESPDSVARVSG